MPISAAPVLDVLQLHSRAFGDESLKIEILALFVAEAERLLRQVETAPNRQVRGDRLRAMAALARNVGAARLAQAARLLESEIAGDEPDLEPLRQAVSETLAYLGEAKV